MGKHSFVAQTKHFAGTPVFKAAATATAVGTFLGIGSSVASATPQEESLKDVAPSAVAATVDLSDDATATVDAAQPVASGWVFNVATAEVKPEAPRAVQSRAENGGKTATEFNYQPVPYNGSLGSQIVGIAGQGIGRPYVYGGSTPAGWDCSGFVMWILAQTGRSVPHNADLIAAMYAPIPASEAQPGDLVWWPGRHIAVYAGDGMIIGAQNERIGTVHTSLYGNYQFVRVS